MKRKQNSPSIPFPGAQLGACGALLFLALCLASWAGAASAESGNIFNLMPGLQARLGAQGELSLFCVGRRQVLINLGAADEVFMAFAAEGADHGLRGFSPGADDDRDGMVDEDRLDGRDNDGDGMVDEDFAAIGDRMAVWRREDATGTVHAEIYHWFYDFLKTTIFLELDSSTRRDFAFQSPLPWILTDVAARRVRAQGEPEIRRTHAWITVFRDDEDGETWVGLEPLDPDTRLEPAGLGELKFQSNDHPAALAVTVAATWDQLCSALCAAEDVYRGVRDPVTGRSVPWIVGPTESLVSVEGDEPWSWRSDSAGGGNLTLEAPAGVGRIPDLATLVLGAVALPLPETVGAEGPTGEQVVTIDPVYRYQNLLRGQPVPTPLWEKLEALGPRETSWKLILHYATAPLALQSAVRGDEVSLEGRGMDGCRLRGTVTVEEPLAISPAEDIGDFAADPSRQSTLSPDLMLGWPNPFRDRVQIRCRIPATPQEAFALQETEAGFSITDKTVMPLPWGDGEPSVSVRIYSING
ncbi:hypothetical protein GW813_05030, partial [bacterium]|nr:hypothetical protein [bacterium]